MKQLDYIILWWFSNLKSHGIVAFLTRRGVCWRLIILTWQVSNFPWFSNQDNSMFFHGWSFPMYPSFRPFIRSNIVLFFIYFFFHLFYTVLTYFLLKKFKRWAHHWISLTVYINKQKPRWNFFFLIVYEKEMRLFGDCEVNVRILQQRNIAEYSGENISNLSFILRGSEDLYQQIKETI